MKTIVFVKEVPETPDGVKVSDQGQMMADAGGASSPIRLTPIR